MSVEMLLFLYIILASLLSIYYGIRGIFMQRIHSDQLNIEIEKDKGRKWKKREIIFVRYIQDFIFNFVCSIAGFFALFLEYKIFLKIENIAAIDTGTSLLLVFLSLLAIAGISGQLPFLLLHGRFPGSKQ